MPGIFPTRRRDDRSLMSSLIAAWLPSYESHQQSLTQSHTHSHERSYCSNELQGSRPKTLACVPRHMINTYIIWCTGSIPVKPFDTNTHKIECYVTYSITSCTLKSPLTSSRESFAQWSSMYWHCLKKTVASHCIVWGFWGLWLCTAV